jgi:hypothetical protein
MRLLALACAIAPWFVLLVSLIRRGASGRPAQNWQIDTTIIGVIGAVATVAWADHAIGWIAYGAALLRHGSASISSRVGTAYERLVALPGGDAHAVECLGVQRFYSSGAIALGAIAAVVAGAWPAVASLVTSEIYAILHRARAAEGAPTTTTTTKDRP